MIAVEAVANPWAFQAHPQVWLLVGSLAAAYVYVIRVLEPRAVGAGAGRTTSRQQLAAFAALGLLLVASDWPMHDISEEYLYSAHMLQHMMLAYFVPPLALLGTPAWFVRTLIGTGRLERAFRFFCRPVIAGVLFNLVVMVTHIPALVNRSAESSPVHYSLHVLLVGTALLMWMPICGPLPEARIGYGARMIYLFLQSVVPTVPAGWLTFAEGVVYRHYNTPVRVFDLSPTYDQQVAGLIMKIGGGMYLWTLVIVMFFTRFAKRHADDNSYRRSDRMPTAEIVGHDEIPMTYQQVADVFERTAPASEPVRS